MNRRYRYFFNLLLSVVFLLSACNPSGEEPRKTADTSQGPEKRFSLGGAPIEVIVRLSTESLKLTDYLTVTVQIEHDESVQVEPPYLSEAVYAPLLLVQAPQEDLVWSEARNRVVKSWVYRFEPMRSGAFKLNPFRVFFRLKSEQQTNLSQWPVYKIDIEEIPYQVTSVPLDEQADIRDIKGLILPPYDFRPLLATVSALALLMLLAWSVIQYRNRRQAGDTIQTVTIDFLKESLRRLDELEQQDYISKREYERLHVELSAIMRYFIENRFGLKALELTTEEFIRAIQYSPHFGSEQQAILRQFMELADLVKFATYDPGSNASQEALKTVRYFIESTRNPDEH